MFPPPPTQSSNANTRYQYDQNPYPEIPIEQIPTLEAQGLLLAKCNFITPYYLRNRRIPDLSQCHILDIGCGSGWKTLALAMANPGAQVLGIDFSAPSIAMAKARAQFHGLNDRLQFQCLSLEYLQPIDRQFDMIHCDEVLYLIQDPLLCLQLCQKLLKPNGVLRGNFHSQRQRHHFYQFQEFLREIGLFHDHSDDTEVELSRTILEAIKPDVVLKQRLPQVSSNETIRMNFMLQGDRGFTIPQVFRLLEAAELEYLQMLDWPSWQVLDLFSSAEKSDRSNVSENSNILENLGNSENLENLENLSTLELLENLGQSQALEGSEISEMLDISKNFSNEFLLSLENSDPETQLNLYDLLHPVHRLLDFWCGHPLDSQCLPPSPEDWTPEQYHQAIVLWHPLLCNEFVLQQFLTDLQNFKPFEISKILPIVSSDVRIQPHLAACLLPLFAGEQPLSHLIDRYFQLYPVNPFTNQSNTLEDVLSCLLPSLLDLEKFTYILFKTV